MYKYISQQIEESISIKEEILKDKRVIKKIIKVSKSLIKAYKKGNKLLVAGNGGSAGDAQHISAELVSRFYLEREALSAIALTTDTSIITAIGNDYGYKDIFARQIEANGNKGDIFLAISTSGNSKNIIKAIKQAKKQKLLTVGLTGAKESKMDMLCDIVINIPSQITPRVQEIHILIGHILCDIIEKEMFG
ncbi:Phosphoheptose isomerase 1 [hydrothermal vent metagenome]|uniref:D-sedoheptulose-7-phosphate isomerase n=1 Tax=hydrothermal vent metagenome TaxID=652676 RepID=A0A1W1EJ47_9ZZZZ